jgi:hypothetical protein
MRGSTGHGPKPVSTPRPNRSDRSRARCVARSSRVSATTQSSKLWKFRDATKCSRRALNLAPIRHGYCRWLHTQGIEYGVQED